MTGSPRVNGLPLILKKPRLFVGLEHPLSRAGALQQVNGVTVCRFEWSYADAGRCQGVMLVTLLLDVFCVSACSCQRLP